MSRTSYLTLFKKLNLNAFLFVYMSSLMTILLLWVTDLQKDRVKNKKEGGLSSSQMCEKAGDRKGRGFQCECTHLEGKGGVLSCVRARRGDRTQS